MFKLVSSALAVAGVHSFGIARSQEPDWVVDLTNPVTKRTTEQNGLDVSDGAQTIALKQISGTGYTWQQVIVPEGCVSVEETDIRTTDLLQPGAPTTKHWELTQSKNAKSGGSCVVSMALARVWMFSGFDANGDVIDPASAIETVKIPIN